MRPRFILSEIGIGLRRNLAMTISVILTTAVALAFLGTSLLLVRQVNAMKDYWYDKVEVSVFLCGQGSEAPTCSGGSVTPAQRDQVKTDLESLPQVQHVFYESKQEAYARFTRQFKDSAIAANVTPDQLPESFRVKLKNPTQFPVVKAVLDGQAGIEQVQDQKALLDKFFSVISFIQLGSLGLATIMGLVALLLVGNTIRVAAYSRRRETGIMKLVGASRLSIQLPFLLEGTIAALLGATLATGWFAVLKGVLVDRILKPNLPLTNYIGWGDVWFTVPWVVLAGVSLAALASLASLRAYVRV